MRKVFWLLLALLVVFRFLTTRPIYKDGQKIRITETIISEPTKFSNYQNLKVAGLKISLPAYPEVHYGDKVIVEGTVENGELKNAFLKSVSEQNIFFLDLRKSLLKFYQKSLPEPHVSLLSGIVLGSKSSLPKNFGEALKKTGTMHVVVASGMNVSISAGVLMSLILVFLPRKKAIYLALLATWFYVFLSGIQPPIVRAGIMGSIVFIAQAFGRLSNAWTAMVLSALIMLIIVPSWIYDLGFILSFVATSSLMLFQKKIEGVFAWMPRGPREGFTTSLAAQIGVAPILFVTFGQFNPLSPVINALVLWTIPAIMIIGGVGGLAGIFVPVLGKLILYLSYPLTWWFISVISFFG